MFTVTAPDGAQVQAADEGDGPTVLILHPGLDDGGTWARVAAALASRYRVLRPHRRPYRLDLPTPATIADEVGDVLALATAVRGPMVIVGHSSGGVVALEALVTAPERFAGAVLYEPPLVTGPPLGGAAYAQAQAAISDDRPGLAMRIFLRDVVQVPPWLAGVAGLFTALIPRLRRWAPRQVAEVGAIDALGCRLEAYAAITAPVVLLGGDASPAHLGERLDALGAALPHAERVTLSGQGHDAQRRAPAAVAKVIDALAHRVLLKGVERA